MRGLLRRICRIPGVECGGLYLVEPKRRDLELVAHWNISVAFQKQASRVPAGSPRYARAIRTAPHYYGPRDLLGPTRREGIRALAVLPIRHRSRVIAVLNLASRTARGFSPEVKLAVESIAAQIGSAVARLRLEDAAERNRQNFQTLFGHIEDMLFVADTSGRLLECNAATLKRLGYSRKRMLGMAARELHPPDRWADAALVLQDVLAGRRDICTLPLLRRNGRQIPVETRLVLGIWNQEPALLGVSRDITKRLQTEDALRRTVDRLSKLEAIINRSPAVVFLWKATASWPMEFVSENVSQFGYQASDLTSGRVAWSALVHPDDLRRLDEELDLYLREGTNAFSQQYRIRTRSGLQRWVQDWNLVMRDQGGTPTHVQAIALDVTEHHHLEEELVEVGARERRKVGDDLHDQLGQQLAGISFLCDALARSRHLRDPELAAKTGRIGALVRDAITQVRQIARGLSPVDPEDEGLATSLSQLAWDTSNLYKLDCRCNVVGTGRVQGHVIASQLHRIAQEAVNNAVRHGQPRHIVIRLETDGPIGRLVVLDDGKGIRAKGSREPGMGMRIMRRRAQLIGGVLTVERSRPRGTQVACTFQGFPESKPPDSRADKRPPRTGRRRRSPS